MTTFTQRPQRANAGKTSKYSDYSVVSFPQLKKHSIIKSSLINIDPLSPIGAQSGSIKAFGDRKKLMIIKTGTHQEMQEISSRFSKEAGSEEIFIPDYECERPHFSDIRQQTMDEDMDDDDEYSPTVTHRTKKATQSMTTTGKKQTITTTDSLSLSLTSGFDDDDDFNRILPNTSASTVTKSAKRKNPESDSSSLSASSGGEHEENRWSKNKENLIKTNLDLSTLKSKKSKKRQRANPTVAQESNEEIKILSNEINLLKKRVSKLEKVYSVVKKNSSFDRTAVPSSNSQSNMDEDLFKKVEKIFNVDPTTLKSPINRPTKIMRELYKSSPHELSNWKNILEPNESVLKDFIQQKCLILDEDIFHTWSTIINSMSQMPYDAVKYNKLKSNNNSLSATPILNDATTTTTTNSAAPSSFDLLENEPEE